MTTEWGHGDRCWHVSPSVNRGSIERGGLNWNLMGITGGIASGASPPGTVHRPEAPVVFLCSTRGETEFFTGFGQHPLVDVWEVDVAGVALEDGPDGWLICRSPIPPSRIRLVDRDIRPA